MKRQAAFIGQQPLLKGVLHTHTTRSDGSCTPEEVLALLAGKGYDFAALTDHRLYNYKNFGSAPLTLIPGMEMDVNMPGLSRHCHHIVSIGPLKEQGNGYEQDETFDRGWTEKPEDTQPYLDDMHARGNLAILCHPQWSGTPVDEFECLQGFFAMEVWNSLCAISCGTDQDNGAYWDTLLYHGRKIYAMAADDGHQSFHFGNGWIRVNSQNTVSAILDALKNGAFYASCGPEIYDFYVEDGMAHVKCSPAAQIGLRHMTIPYRAVFNIDKTPVTEAHIPLQHGIGTQYVRAVVTDAQGHKAWSNPIFLDEEDFMKN